ncbi:uncharacterized protein LOC117679126 [Pantherophis guttatus]|uniref:Uncharacterized protein LOC117679126 n=1 Tax=Pantherophis guttatus TaxID=94885 RepID=A0A6P9DLD3_PANGU|nr:uncharacterized protein LOC117679126 [Pantherophis guttatus]
MASQRPARTSKHPPQQEEFSSSDPVPAKRSRKTHHTSKGPKPSQSAAMSKEEFKRHKAIEKAIQKAIQAASLQEKVSLSPHPSRVVTPSASTVPPPTGPEPAASPAQPQGVDNPGQALSPALSPDRDSPLPEGLKEVNAALFGPQPEVSSAPSQPQGIPVQVSTALTPPAPAPEPQIAPNLASFIREAIRMGVREEMQRTSSWVSSHSFSQVDVEGSILSVAEAAPQGPESPAQAKSTDHSDKESISAPDPMDQDLSEDEDLGPDQPAFVGLFKPQLFRSLLHKAKAITGLGSSQASSVNTGEGPSSSIPLFEVPTIESEEIPGPKIFRDVLQRQWAAPASGPSPNVLDRRLYNLAPELSSLLQVPSVDQPVAELSAPTNLTGPPEEGLRPEDRRLEHSLVRSHQATAWSVKASLAASFFNRASILWLRQLQARLPVSDLRAQQDISKIIAALDFSADATLNSSRFAAKAIGSSIAARRLLWLRQWQADAKSKWRLASSPFEGPKLFGAPLEPLLIESKDKRRILPSLSRRSDFRSQSNFRPFRPSDGGFSGSRRQRFPPPRQFRPQDRQGPPPRGQSRRPFRGSRGRAFRRSR